MGNRHLPAARLVALGFERMCPTAPPPCNSCCAPTPTGGQATDGMLVSAGADGTTAISDPRASFGLVAQVKLSNFPYSMAAAGACAPALSAPQRLGLEKLGLRR